MIVFRKYRVPVIGMLLFLSVASCKKKDSETAEVPPTLMTLRFTDDYINPKLSAIVFISDAAGKVLGDTLVSGNGTISVTARPGVTVPGKFSVTIATWEPGMHNFAITLNTFLDISRGTWALQGHRADTTGHYALSLVNIPAISGALLFSNTGYSNVTLETTGLTGYLYLNPDDLYVKINTAQGPKFKWYAGLQTGGSYTVSLDTLENARTKDITLPFTAQSYTVTLSGYPGTVYESPLSYLCDEVISEGTAVNHVTVAFPPGKFTGYNTSLEIAENYTTSATYTYHVDGDIPAAFRKIDAGIQGVTSTLPGTAVISTSGTYTASATSWFFNATNRQAFIWNIYAPDSVKTLKLPALSPGMTRMFPVLSKDSLLFWKTEVMDFPAAGDYTAWTLLLFDPANPHRMEHLEASTLRVLAGK